MIDLGPRPSCIVCGAAGCGCGQPTTVIPVDTIREGASKVGPMKRYPNPAGGDGAFLVLSDADAVRAGHDPKKGKPHLTPATVVEVEQSDESYDTDDDDEDTDEGPVEAPAPATGKTRKRSTTKKRETPDGDKSGD